MKSKEKSEPFKLKTIKIENNNNLKCRERYGNARKINGNVRRINGNSDNHRSGWWKKRKQKGRKIWKTKKKKMR